MQPCSENTAWDFVFKGKCFGPTQSQSLSNNSIITLIMWYQLKEIAWNGAKQARTARKSTSKPLLYLLRQLLDVFDICRCTGWEHVNFVKTCNVREVYSFTLNQTGWLSSPSSSPFLLFLLCRRRPLMSSTLLSSLWHDRTYWMYIGENYVARKALKSRSDLGKKNIRMFLQYCLIKGDIHATWQPFPPLHIQPANTWMLRSAPSS